MKIIFVFAIGLLVSSRAFSQGTLVFDQQSSTDETYSTGGVAIQFYGFVGQSFTPSLSMVGFVRVKLFDTVPANGIGATLVMNLRSNSINGPILGTSTLTLGNGFSGSTNFIFASGIAVVPSLTYFFETTVLAGDSWAIRTMDSTTFDNYPNGFTYAGPNTFTGGDVWFREGILVPEPTFSGFLACGALAFLLARRRR